MGKRASEEKKPKQTKKFRKEEPVEDDSVELSELSEDQLDSDELDESEDELDGSDLEGSDLEEDVDEKPAARENGGDQDAAYLAAKKKEQKEEQKKARQERKLQKPLGQEIATAKKLWEEFRQKTIPTAERKKLVAEAYELIKDNTKDLVLRHDSSRVVQSIFKYADQKTRAEITKALKGSYVLLAKSSYGKYLLVKMLHYGSAATRQSILDELHGSFRKLMGHKEGAYVIEDAFRDYSTASQRRQMLREFYGSQFALFKDAGAEAKGLDELMQQFPEKSKFLLENLNEVITAAVNKGSIGFEIIHAAMLEYIRNIPKNGPERETFIDLVTEQIAEMVHTRDGSQVASLVFALANAKERKKLLKTLKQFGDKLAADQYGNLVLMAIFRTVDDTVLVSKTFTPPLEDQFIELTTSKFGRRPWLYLAVGLSKKYFVGDISKRFQEIDEFKATTSKKDDETRHKELLGHFSPLIFRLITERVDELVQDSIGMQFAAEMLEHGDQSCEEWKSALEAVVAKFEGSPSEDEHPISTPFAGRALKAMAKGIPEGRALIAEAVSGNEVAWASGDGSFVIVSLLENLEDPSSLRKALKKHKKSIQAAKPKGVDILVKLL